MEIFIKSFFIALNKSVEISLLESIKFDIIDRFEFVLFIPSKLIDSFRIEDFDLLDDTEIFLEGMLSFEIISSSVSLCSNSGSLFLLITKALQTYNKRINLKKTRFINSKLQCLFVLLIDIGKIFSNCCILSKVKYTLDQ